MDLVGTKEDEYDWLEWVMEGCWTEKTNGMQLMNFFTSWIEATANSRKTYFQDYFMHANIDVKNAMIKCGLSLNLNGRWEEAQISPEWKELNNS